MLEITYSFHKAHYFQDWYRCGAERVNDTMTCRETFEFVLRNSIKHYNEPVMNYLSRFHRTPGGSKSKIKSKLLRRIKKKTNKNRNKIKRKCKRSRRKN